MIYSKLCLIEKSIAQTNNIELLEKRLIDKKIRNDICDSLGRKLVHQFCIFGNLQGLKKLIEIEGKQILNVVDKFGTNCAHLASRNGYGHILQSLSQNEFKLWNEKEKR